GEPNRVGDHRRPGARLCHPGYGYRPAHRRNGEASANCCNRALTCIYPVIHLLHMAARRLSLVSMLLALCSGAAQADEPLTLDRAVEVALVHHPALQAEASVEEARRAQVSVARAGYLPSVDLSLQVNGGSGNVLRGALSFMRGIPNVSGPPTGR